MEIYKEKLLRWYLKKQYLSHPAPKQSNLLNILKRSGWPEISFIYQSCAERLESFNPSELKKLFLKNQIVEVSWRKTQRIVVPKELAWDFIKIQDQPSPPPSCSALELLRQIEEKPQTISELERKLSKQEEKTSYKSSLDYLLEQGEVLMIYNFAKKAFEYTRSSEILGRDLSQSSGRERFKKIILEFFKIYGPATLSEVAQFSGKSLDYLRAIISELKAQLCSLKVVGLKTAFIAEKNDLNRMISWSGQARFQPNLVWKNDHALKFKKPFLEKLIAGYKFAEYLALNHGEVVALFDKEGRCQALPNFPDQDRKLLNSFKSLLKLRRSQNKLKLNF